MHFIFIYNLSAQHVGRHAHTLPHWLSLQKSRFTPGTNITQRDRVCVCCSQGPPPQPLRPEHGAGIHRAGQFPSFLVIRDAIHCPSPGFLGGSGSISKRSAPRGSVLAAACSPSLRPLAHTPCRSFSGSVTLFSDTP